MNVKDLARGKWAGILPRLGIDEGVLDGKHHPCPKTGDGRDRFRFADKDGRGNYFCDCNTGRGCGIDLAICVNGWSFAEAAKEIEKVVRTVEPDKKKIPTDPLPALRRIRSLAKPAGEAVASYLAARGLETPSTLFQARLDYFETRQSSGKFDVMLGLIKSAEGKPVSWHLTYLDGAKKANVGSPRKIKTPVGTINGSAIRLYPAEAHLGIAEGIETAIAAHQLYSLPVWSVMNKNGIRTFDPPAVVSRLTIFADNDANFAGQAAAYVCAERLMKKGIACEVLMPDQSGTDWNDVLIQRGKNQ